MPQLVRKLVFKLAAPNRCPARSVTERVSGLNHKFRNHAMEDNPLKETTARVPNKILNCLWRLCGEKPHVHVAHRGVDRGRVGKW
jgi:hypothetical protein